MVCLVLRLHLISSRASCITVVKKFTFLQDTVGIHKHTHTQGQLSHTCITVVKKFIFGQDTFMEQPTAREGWPPAFT